VSDPGFSVWPSPLSLAGPRSFRLKFGFSIAGYPTCLLVDVLRHPGIITPTGVCAPARTPARPSVERCRQLTADAAMTPALALSSLLNTPTLISTFVALK
jgi:hypothetical protein